MTANDPQQLISILLQQALASRLSQSKFLSLLHQLVRRIEASESTEDASDTSSLSASHAAGVLIRNILGQTFIDPLLIEYLQAIIYGSANRTGVTPDQGPVSDVITVTLHLLANVKGGKESVEAIETVSSVVGQGLLMTFQGPTAFRVGDVGFLQVLQHLFGHADTEMSIPGGNIAPASLAFITSNLKLLALAADPSIASPQNLLAPRVAITVLVNVGQSLLAYVIQALNKAKPDTAVSQAISSASQSTVSEIESVLQSMNPAWKDEIALLRSLSSQISTIDSLTGTSTGHSQADSILDARASWDHFLDTPSLTPSSSPSVEPEVALLLRLLIDLHTTWKTKLDSVKTLFLARRAAAAPSLTLEKSLTSFYYELLSSAICACAIVVETPPAFKGAETYSSIWRNALCGLIPELILQLEEWLDANPDLPLRGQRIEAPHVRVENALRSALFVQADRLEVCETATTAANDMDVVGMDAPQTQPIKAFLLRSFIEHALCRPEAIADEFPSGHLLASSVQALPQSLRMDAQLEGLGLQVFFESRITHDDPVDLLERVSSDPGTHYAFATQLLTQLGEWVEAGDLESVARWCKVLSESIEGEGGVLDTIMLYTNPSHLAAVLGGVLEKEDVNQTSDEPSTLSNILLFVQLVAYRYDIAPATAKKSVINTFLSSASFCPPLSTLPAEEKNLVSRWITALFGNEGISDDLISSSPPATLLRLSPLLFSQSISACQFGLIDLETLRGGLSYFLQDLLLFALPGAINWLLGEIPKVPQQGILEFLGEDAKAGLENGSDGVLVNGISRVGSSRTVYLEVLGLVLENEGCPGVVKECVASSFDGFVRAIGQEGEVKGLESGCETFNLASVRSRMEGRGVTAKMLSERSAWLSTMVGGATIPQLLAGDARGRVLVKKVLSMAKEAGGVGEAKLCAALLSLLSPAVRGLATVHPALSFVHNLDFAPLEGDEAALQGVVRVLGLIMDLAKAAEVVEGGRSDEAEQILALSTIAPPQVKEAREEKDLFEDDGEPTTPPLPSAADKTNGSTASGPNTFSLLASSPTPTTTQLQDLLTFKILPLQNTHPSLYTRLSPLLLSSP